MPSRFLFAAVWACAWTVSVPAGISFSGWSGNPVAWDFDSASGSIHANGLRDMAVLSDERCARMSFSALLQPEAGGTNDWSTMGLAFCDDEENYWHLALAQAPPNKASRRFFELVEMREGRWLAQHRDHLVGTVGHKSSSWEYGQAYSASLTVDPSGIRGEVRDAQGKIVFSARYSFPAPDAEGKVKAVTCGRPALNIKGTFKGMFAALDVHTSEPRSKPSAASAFPPYSPIGIDTGIREKPTGFFHVAKCADGRWWTIDPLGRGVVMTGVDHVKYQGIGSARTKRNRYLEANTRKYPDRSDWETNTLARLKAWGFSMLGGGCNPTLERRGLAHSRALGLSNGVCLDYAPPEFYICPNERRPCTAFPNVFHPKFGQYCDYVARKKCASNRDDPWLVGYFIDNELAWWGRGARDTGLFNAVAQLPDSHPARQAQRAFLAAKGVKEPVTAEVKLDFLRLAAERYFSATTSAIRRADPNHMVLGARFAGIGGAHEEVWRIAAKYCDAVTFNCYPWADLDRNEMRMSRSASAPRMADAFARLYEVTGRPLLVTEWSFPALDSGLPCTHGAGQRFPTQRLRTRASELFAKTLLALPFMLGYNYFMWVDEPPEGVSDAFPEDSNYGLVSERDEAYPDLVSMFAQLHRNIGDWRRADVPAVRTSSPKASLRAGEACARLSVGRGCVCSREGDCYRVTNAAGLVLEGRVGGSSIFDRVVVNGVELGRFTGMMCRKVGGKQRWSNLARVTAAEGRKDALIVSGEGVDGNSRFAFTFSIAPLPDRPWFFCELLEMANAGTSPLEVHSVLLRQYVPYATDKEGNERFRGIPNLWGAPLADAWFRQADEAYFGGYSCAPAATLFRYYTSHDGRVQHPDAVFTPLSPVTLAPGEKYVPNGTVWMVALGGTSGGRQAWDTAVKELARDLKNTDHGK